MPKNCRKPRAFLAEDAFDGLFAQAMGAVKSVLARTRPLAAASSAAIASRILANRLRLSAIPSGPRRRAAPPLLSSFCLSVLELLCCYHHNGSWSRFLDMAEDNLQMWVLGNCLQVSRLFQGDRLSNRAMLRWTAGRNAVA